MTVGSFGDQSTRWSSGPSAARRRQFSAMTDRLRCSVSAVSQARCGVTTTFGRSRSGSCGLVGSWANTSSPAPRRSPLFSAATSAASSGRTRSSDPRWKRLGLRPGPAGRSWRVVGPYRRAGRIWRRRKAPRADVASDRRQSRLHQSAEGGGCADQLPSVS